MTQNPREARFQRLLKIRSRQLRKEATPAEVSLWQILRNRKVTGLKFRRQQRLGRFVADFFCAEVKLVVELDGAVHENQADRDAAREEVLERGEVTILRFKNGEVLEDQKAVILRIVAEAERLRAQEGPETRTR